MADCQIDFASIVIIDDFSLDMPETSRSGGDLCVLFTFVVRAVVERLKVHKRYWLLAVSQWSLVSVQSSGIAIQVMQFMLRIENNV